MDRVIKATKGAIEQRLGYEIPEYKVRVKEAKEELKKTEPVVQIISSKDYESMLEEERRVRKAIADRIKYQKVVVEQLTQVGHDLLFHADQPIDIIGQIAMLFLGVRQDLLRFYFGIGG